MSLKANVAAETTGIWFEEDDLGIHVKVAHRDNRKAKILSSKLSAPYVRAMQHPTSSTFQALDKVECQVLAQRIWLGTESRDADGKWHKDKLFDPDTGELIDVSTVEARFKVLVSDEWRPLRDYIEGCMRDSMAFNAREEDSLLDPEPSGEALEEAAEGVGKSSAKPSSGS